MFDPSPTRLPVTETPQIVVVGCGAIGLPLATAFAARGCDVLGVDTDPARLAALRARRVGLIDEGLGDALATAVGAGRLAFTDTIAPADRPRAFILVVPTPVDTDGAPLLGNVEAGADAIVAAARDDDLLLVRATVPVGTTRRLAGIAAKQGRRLHLAACPDRSVAGRCFVEQFSVPHIVGGMDGAATRAAAPLLARLGPTVAVSSPEVAEAAKLFANVQRDAGGRRCCGHRPQLVGGKIPLRHSFIRICGPHTGGRVMVAGAGAGLSRCGADRGQSRQRCRYGRGGDRPTGRRALGATAIPAEWVERLAWSERMRTIGAALHEGHRQRR